MGTDEFRLVNLECLGCGAPVKESRDGFYLECKYCGNSYGMPDSMNVQNTEPPVISSYSNRSRRIDLVFKSYQDD